MVVGDAIGDNSPISIFELLRRNWLVETSKTKSLRSKLVDVTDGANPVDLGKPLMLRVKLSFSKSLTQQARRLSLSCTEVPSDEDVVYDKLEANITIQVVRETVDNQLNWLPRLPIQKTLSLTIVSNTSQGPKSFGMGLTKAGVTRSSRSIPICSQRSLGKVLETVGRRSGYLSELTPSR